MKSIKMMIKDTSFYKIVTLFYKNIKCAYFYRQTKKRFPNAKGDKISIVFLILRTNTWNSKKSIYEAAKACNFIKTYIVALPIDKNGNIDLKDNHTYEFCRTIDSNAIKAYDLDTNTYFELAKLEPDYIFLDLPYEMQYPQCYRFYKLAQIAKLCYVPYGYTLKNSKLQKISVRIEIIIYASYIFVCNNMDYDYYNKLMFLSELINGKRLYNIGFPRFDLYKNLNYTLPKSNKIIMWLPRWTTEHEVSIDGNEPSSFFEIKDKLLDYMEKHTEDRLIVRPHPLAFDNYVSHNLMTEDEVEVFKKRIDMADNVIFDDNPSYYDNLIKADILIADFTSILAEFFVTGRPIIYFGNGDNYPPEHMGMYNSFYQVKNWNDAERCLTNLKKEIDSKKEQRKKAVDNFIKGKPKNVGEHIVNILAEDYQNGKQGSSK